MEPVPVIPSRPGASAAKSRRATRPGLSAAAAFLARWRIGDPQEWATAATGSGSAALSPARVIRSVGGDPFAAWETDPDHHLWRNGRRWWVAFTVVEDGWRQERVRLSLGTHCRDQARVLRDALFARIEGAEGCALSLRAAPARRCA